MAWPASVPTAEPCLTLQGLCACVSVADVGRIGNARCENAKSQPRVAQQAVERLHTVCQGSGPGMLEASRLDLSSAALPYVQALGMLLPCGMKHNHLGEYSERPRATGASWIPGEHRVYYVCTGMLYEVQNTEHGAWSILPAVEFETSCPACPRLTFQLPTRLHTPCVPRVGDPG